MDRRTRQRLAYVTAGVIVADWWSKFLVLNRVALYERVTVLGDWLYFVRTSNRGVAFSILNTSDAVWRTPLLLLVGCATVLILLRASRAIVDVRSGLGLALVVGGALGNLGDRAANGAVTDFVVVRAFPFIFNAADVAITVGGLLLALGLALPRAADETPAEG
jgi:signal peptidase II